MPSSSLDFLYGSISHTTTRRLTQETTANKPRSPYILDTLVYEQYQLEATETHRDEHLEKTCSISAIPKQFSSTHLKC